MTQTMLTEADAHRPLQGLRVGLSGAVPERESWPPSDPDLDRSILRFVGHFAGLVYEWGGTIIHGSHPAFSPILLSEARNHGARQDGEPLLTLIRAERVSSQSSLRFVRQVGRDADLLYAAVSSAPGDASSERVHKTAMRMVLTANIDVLVALGGRTHGGKPPSGVIDELTLAALYGIPAIPVAAFGGSTAALGSRVLSRYAELSELSVKDRERLSDRDYMETAAGRLIVHLAARSEAWVSARTQRATRPLPYTYVEATRGDDGARRVVIAASHVVDTLKLIDERRSSMATEEAVQDAPPINSARVEGPHKPFPSQATTTIPIRVQPASRLDPALTSATSTSVIFTVADILASLQKGRRQKLCSRYLLDTSTPLVAGPGPGGARVGLSRLRTLTLVSDFQKRELKLLCERIQLDSNARKSVLAERVHEALEQHSVPLVRESESIGLR